MITIIIIIINKIIIIRERQRERKRARKTMLRRVGNQTYSLLFRVTHIDRRANVSQQ